MNTSEFTARIFAACETSPIVISTFVADTGATWIQIRVLLIDDSFIDTFFNQATGKTAYAWIKHQQRIIGADNTHRWHWHPFTAPETHVPAKDPVSFADFLHEVENHLTPSNSSLTR